MKSCSCQIWGFLNFFIDSKMRGGDGIADIWKCGDNFGNMSPNIIIHKKKRFRSIDLR